MSDVKTKRLPKYMQVLKALRIGMENVMMKCLERTENKNEND